VKETVTESGNQGAGLAEELYETYRQAQRLIDSANAWNKHRSCSNRGLDEPARTLADQAGEGIRRLREQIEQSSESVLGSEQQSLRTEPLRELICAREALQPETQSSARSGVRFANHPRPSELAANYRTRSNNAEGQSTQCRVSNVKVSTA
jgi:hypothetical protein